MLTRYLCMHESKIVRGVFLSNYIAIPLKQPSAGSNLLVVIGA